MLLLTLLYLAISRGLKAIKGLTMEEHDRPRAAKYQIDSINNHMSNLGELFTDINFIEVAGSKGSVGDKVRQTLVILNDDLRIMYERLLGLLLYTKE